MLLALLLAAAATARGDTADTAAAPAIAAPVAAPDRAFVQRSYSLRSFARVGPEIPSALSAFPLLIASGFATPPAESFSEPTLMAEDIVALIRSLIEPQLWDEMPESSLRLTEDQRLAVSAPDDVQTRIAELLGRLERDLVPTEQLELRLLPAEAGDATSNDLLIESAAADERIKARGVLANTSVALRELTPVAARAGDQTSFLWDWEIEIAQSAAAADPVFSHYETGLKVIAQSVRVEGGLLVNLLVRSTASAGPTLRRRLAAKSLIVGPPANLERPAAGTIDEPQLAFATFMGTLLLPEGKALLLPVTVATAHGEVSLCLDLRAKLGSAKPACVIESMARPGGGEAKFTLRRALATQLQPILAPHVHGGLFDANWSIEANNGDLMDCGTGILQRGAAVDFLLDTARQLAAEPIENGHGDVSVMSSSHLLSLLPPAVSDRVDAALATLSSSSRLEAGFLVRGRINVGGQPRATFRLPAFPDRPAALFAGVNRSVVSDWDVDVANNCCVPNPSVEGLVDGFGLRVELTRNLRNEVVVALQGKVHLLQGLPQPVELDDASALSIDRVGAVDSLFVDEVRTLPAKGGTLTFGGVAGGQLELEIVPLAR